MDMTGGEVETPPRGVWALPLRIGLLVDRRDGFENWQLAVIDRILADDRLRLQAMLVSPPRRGHASTAFRLATWLERSMLGRQPPYRPSHIRFGDLPWRPLDGKHDERDSAELDLVLAISPSSVPVDRFSALPFGAWHVSFLDDANATTSWFGYDEVMTSKSATELRIDVSRSGGEAETLAKGEFNTKFSAVRNGDFIKERAATLVMRELRKLAETRTMTTLPSPRPSGATAAPRAWSLLAYAIGVGRELARRGRQAVAARLKIGAAPWALFVGSGRPEDFDPRKAVLLKPEDDELRADPFLFQHEGETFIFYEAYTPRDSKAHIAVGRLVGDRLERIGIALSADHHLSYPFVFRDGNGIFMIPETNQARRLEVWRCVDFPLRWQLHATALEGQSSADSALVSFGGRWWLFSNLSEFHAYEDHCSELHVFEVDGPSLRSITPHRNNPVVIGSTEARNAGRPFEVAGRLFRPSQRNEHGIYGWGLNIMEIEELDLGGYRERCVRTIEPDFAPGIIACHHMDACDGRYVIDAMFADQASLLR